MSDSINNIHSTETHPSGGAGGAVIVYLEMEGGIVGDVSLELLTKGRTLADRLGCKLEAVAAGYGLDGVGAQVFPYGVDTLYVADDRRMAPYTSLPHTSLLVNLFKELKPQVALMGATSVGRDLGPRVSSSLFSGLTADCTSLEIGDYEDKKTGKVYHNLLYQIRPAFGGNIVATIVNPECRPQMATVREGVMKKEIRDAAYQGETVRLDVAKYVRDEDFVMEVIERHMEQSRVNLTAASIIVAGGYGMGSAENFQMLYELADVLGGESGSFPCGSRCGLCRTRTADRPDGHHRASQALHSLRHLRSDTAHRRHAGKLHDHLHQQRPGCSHQHHRRLRHHRHGGRGHPEDD